MVFYILIKSIKTPNFDTIKQLYIPKIWITY